MTVWYILGGFLAYWFLLKRGTPQSLVDAIRNEVSNFSRVNQAGLATGATPDPGSHESFPGACITPLGITTAQPGSMENLTGSLADSGATASTLGTVPTGNALVPVGATRSPYPTRDISVHLDPDGVVRYGYPKAGISYPPLPESSPYYRL